MNEYDTLDELLLGVVDQCLTEGTVMESRDGPVSHELTGWCGKLLMPQANFCFNPMRKMSPHYCAAELNWYLSGDLSIARILPYAPQYSRFANDLAIRRDPETGHESNDPMHPKVVEACAPGAAYGHRLQKRSYEGYTQITHVIRTLQKDPDSRQAILGIWDPNLDPGYIESGITTIPCTLSLQFLIRNGKLNCICTMRSNDVWLGIPNDIFCFTSIFRMIADVLGIEMGYYQHQVGSLHIYKRDLEKCERLSDKEFKVPTSIWRCPSHPSSLEAFSRITGHLVESEQFCREGTHYYKSDIEAKLGKHTFLHDIMCMAGSKWVPRMADDIEWKEMRKYTQEFVK